MELRFSHRLALFGSAHPKAAPLGPSAAGWISHKKSQLTSLELFNPDQKIPEQAFTKSCDFVPEPAPHFPAAMMDVNAPLFRDCPCHNPTPDAKGSH